MRLVKAIETSTQKRKRFFREVNSVEETAEVSPELLGTEAADGAVELLETEAADGAIEMVENSKLEPQVDQTSETWQRVQLARHPERPKTLDYIKRLCPEFVEVHGDRRFGDDGAIVGGLAEFEGRTVMMIGHQKGKNTKENLERNFGMPSPEGYRKALRLMQQAEKFGFPVICFIDTPGAYPGLESEERSVAQAIAENLMVLAQLKVPVISVVIGEGGSGGALAIGLADRVLMLENSIYSVASPEASASILWHDAAKAPQAAASMKITAQHLYNFGIVEEILPEPEGGAHIEPGQMAETVKEAILRHLTELETKLNEGNSQALQQLLANRYAKFRKIGEYEE
jgi:acetyl-CoA carboxylase carboxyl transferase subunit alpha